MQYKILFVGLGSIGNKHLENLSSILTERKISFQIDALRNSKQTHEKINTVYTECNQIPYGYDIIFVTNPTNLHFEAIENLKSKTKNMFIEKPIFEKTYDFVQPEGIYYVACPLRYHPVVAALKDFVKTNKVIGFRAICSSYLPDWRENKDYSNCYSAKAEMGGGVELDLIHEIDYINWIFGLPVKSSHFGKKASDLKISSNDIAQYIFEYKDMLGSLQIDYIGRYLDGAKREIEIYTNDDTIIFDIANNCIKYLKESETKKLKSEDIYKNEMNYFLDVIKNQSESYYNSTDNAINSIKIAKGEKV